MGATFYVVYYLQGVLAHGPLASGAALIPMALGMAVMAPGSSRLAERFGAKAVVGAGFGLLTAAVCGFQLLDTASPLWLLLVILTVQGLGMGTVMAPTTESIMSVVPRHKAGAGAAVNNSVRQVGGALGVAVLGSLLANAYAARLGGRRRRAARPAPARRPAPRSSRPSARCERPGRRDPEAARPPRRWRTAPRTRSSRRCT
jgi:MFS family permease